LKTYEAIRLSANLILEVLFTFKTGPDSAFKAGRVWRSSQALVITPACVDPQKFVDF